MRDYSGAIFDYTKAIKIDPAIAISFYKRGFAMYQLGDCHGATADFAKAFKRSAISALEDCLDAIIYSFFGRVFRYLSSLFRLAFSKNYR